MSYTIATSAPLSGRAAPFQFRKMLDILTYSAALAGALGMAGMLLLLTLVLVHGAWAAMGAFGWHFFVDSEWNPVDGRFGALPVIYGTLVSSFLALLIAVPVSVGTAVFLVRLAPRWLVTPVSFLVEVLAAIPSITYGLWGIAVLIPFLKNQAVPVLRVFGNLPVIGKPFSGPMYGVSMLAAAIIIAIMIVPIVTAVTRDVLRAAPSDLQEGAYALGATWWQATWVVLGFSKMGIFGAVILGLARAIGETMAVVMLIGNTNDINFSLFAPGQTMASLIANEYLEADKPAYSQALIYVALVLLLLTVLLNAAARLLVSSSTKRAMSKPAPPVKLENAITTPHSSEPTAAPVQRRERWQCDPKVRVFSKIMMGLCSVGATLTIALLAIIIGFVLFKGFSSLSWDFFTKLPGPAGDAIGMRNCIIGTVILIGLASIIGIPLGMMCGIYLAEYSRGGWFSQSIRLVVDVLAGTPSIIVGVIVYELVVIPRAWHSALPAWIPLGHYSGVAGSLALAFMMCPIVARTTEEMLKLVPNTYREAALGVGASQFHTLFGVVLPAASKGIITGIMLAVARIAGETAPLMFTALGTDLDVYDPRKQFPALTLKIFQYATSAEPKWNQQAWAGMLVLVAVILVLSIAMRMVAGNRSAAV